MNPKDVLTPDDYTNYRNVRAAAVLFVVLGGILALGGTSLAVRKNPPRQQNEMEPNRKEIHPAAAAVMAVVGLAGAVGGVAALCGSRRWAPLVYVMAVPYICGFPIGTILSYVMLTGLSRYLDSVERVKTAAMAHPQIAQPGPKSR